MIFFNNVNKTYLGGLSPALQGVSFHVPMGEMFFLTGHSGAGKSTILKLILGSERSNGGEILVNNHNISQFDKKKLPFWRQNIGMIYQESRLIQDITVQDNIGLPLVIQGMDPVEIKRRASSMLDLVGLLDKAKLYPYQLSGGEKKRIDIARALINKPNLLLADEPTGSLDEKLALDIFKLFKFFNQQGCTMLIATHDLGLIDNKAKCINLKQGRITHAVGDSR